MQDSELKSIVRRALPRIVKIRIKLWSVLLISWFYGPENVIVVNGIGRNLLLQLSLVSGIAVQNSREIFAPA
jgi:hypothetical protein